MKKILYLIFALSSVCAAQVTDNTQYRWENVLNILYADTIYTGHWAIGSTVLVGLEPSRLVATDADTGLVSTITAANLLASVTGTVGTENLVFSASPTFTGTVNASALTLSSTLTLSGISANLATGSNFISNGGTDDGLSFDASNNATLSAGLTVGGTTTLSQLTANRLVASDASKNLVSTISADNLRSSVTGTTGTVNLVFSANSALTGTTTAESLTFTGTLLASGTAANYALGANFISRTGTDAGQSFDASNNATFSADLTVTGIGVFTGDIRVGKDNAAKIDIDGTDGSETAGQVSLYEIGGSLSYTSRGSHIFVLDNDANASNSLFAIRTNGFGTSNIFQVEESGNVTTIGDLAVNGGDITTTATGTFNLVNTNTQTVNFAGASTATTISATTGLTTIRNNTFIGDQKNFGSSSFVSGFTGAGYQSFYKDSEYWWETDNINIRGTLSAYELLIQQIRATNGSVYISSAQKVDTVITTTVASEVVIMEDPNDDNVAYFVAGDIVLMQRVQIDDPTQLIKRIVRLVDSVASDTVWFDTTGIAKPADVGIVAAGDEYVRIGNTTDTDRQGSVYLTADDVQAPYIDIVDGVASWTDFRSVAKNKGRFGRLSGITDADFGGALTGYGAYVEQGYFKGNIHVKSGVSQALQNSAIQIGNITGMANAALKIAQTGTASTSGFFAYDADGDEIFSLPLSGVGRFISTYFANDDMWAGNASFSSAATTFQLNNFSTVPRLALGDSASGITIANAEPGFIAQGDGQFKSLANATNYIRMTTSALDIAATDFELTSSNLGLSGNTTSSYIKIGTLADATTTATTNSGFRADNNGNVLIKGNVSGTNYLKVTGAGTLDIRASAFSLVAGNITVNSTDENFRANGGDFVATFGQTQDEGGNLTGAYGFALVDDAGATEYVRLDNLVRRISGWTVGNGLLSATNLSLYSGAANTARVEVGTGSNIAGVNSPNSATGVAFWAGATHANIATAPFRVTAGGRLDVATIIDSGGDETVAFGLAGGVASGKIALLRTIGMNSGSVTLQFAVSGNTETVTFPPETGIVVLADSSSGVKIGSVNSVSPTSPNRTITIEIAGTTYYIHAKTTND